MVKNMQKDTMQKKEEQVVSQEILRTIAMRSLRRSNIRKKIVEYLYDISPNGNYIANIATNIQTAPTNVIGAIRGMGLRYCNEESLLELNMIVQVGNGNKTKTYKLTDFGKEIINSMK